MEIYSLTVPRTTNLYGSVHVLFLEMHYFATANPGKAKMAMKLFGKDIQVFLIALKEHAGQSLLKATEMKAQEARHLLFLHSRSDVDAVIVESTALVVPDLSGLPDVLTHDMVRMVGMNALANLIGGREVFLESCVVAVDHQTGDIIHQWLKREPVTMVTQPKDMTFYEHLVSPGGHNIYKWADSWLGGDGAITEWLPFLVNLKSCVSSLENDP